jgi:hypothetical protein
MGRAGFNLKVEEEQGTYERREDGRHTCSLGETHYSLLISFFPITGSLSLTYIKWRVVDHVIMNISYSLIKPYYQPPIPSFFWFGGHTPINSPLFSSQPPSSRSSFWSLFLRFCRCCRIEFGKGLIPWHICLFYYDWWF